MPQSFEELEIWKKAHQLTLKIYEISNQWPKAEIFGLTSQTRRAAVSVELTTAEGHSRYHYKETIQFCYDSRASAQEVRNCLILAKDLKYITTEVCNELNQEYIGLIKGINGFISATRRKN